MIGRVPRPFGSIRLSFRDGGFQEQTGTGCNGKGRACNGFYISNVIEHLDLPGEFVVAAGMIHLKPNATGATGTAWQAEVFAATTEQLIAIVGTQAVPVTHLEFQGCAAFVARFSPISELL